MSQPAPEHPDQFQQIHSVMEATRNITCPVYRRSVKESEIPLEMIYNTKIEKIRAIELKHNWQPQPIKITLQESLRPGFKKAKFDCSSYTNTQLLEINITNQPQFVEGDAERYNRQNKGQLTADDIKITDYTS